MKTLESRRQHWREHVSAWRCSGLSQAKYCRQQGLVARQLGYWVRCNAIDERDVCGVSSDALTLVPARVQATQTEALALVLQNSLGWQLTLPATVPMEWLAALLRGLS